MKRKIADPATGAILGTILGTLLFFGGLLDTRARASPAAEHPALVGELEIPCAECHGDLIEGAFVHPPAAEGECEICHEFTTDGEEWSVALSMPEEEICFTCHENPSDFEEALSHHPPAVEGSCLWCHNPHSSNRESLLKGEGNDLCLECHGEQQEELERPHVHGVIHRLGCHSCHNPHASLNPRLLHLQGNGLCLECHLGTSQNHPLNDTGDVVLFGNRTVETAFFDRIPKLGLPAENLIGHPVSKHPVQGDLDPRRPEEPFGCRSCHEPHGSDRPKLLIGEKGFGLCRKCHDK